MKETIIIDLERFEKTDLERDLDKQFGYRPRTVYEDIQQTYLNAVYTHCQFNIKIQTNLVPPQIYKFGAHEVEIIAAKEKQTV